MMRRVFLVLLLALAGCSSRPMAPGERAFAEDMFGGTLDVDRVRVTTGPGRPPPSAARIAPERLKEIEIRPGLCDRVAPDPGRSEPPPAFALYDRVHLMPDFYRPDMMAGWPEAVHGPQTLVFAHELVHVWQWQNRGRTGYHPVRAALESIVNGDPYFYVPAPGEGFLKYGFEQQAALIEDYMCYLIVDPENPRREEIRKIISPYFTVGEVAAATGR
ncbi:hypothetical protein [Pseudoruegeria sp. HB172150]|uniref:hypothetical protein n=1 Tax=Pseudoruegeria sp. HB172150 TaxID=2721164 RepID=UPI0015552FBA|nr:hypothetical protein [Pseudoruegeria sp. HB172150]